MAQWGIWQQAAQQVGGLVRHAARKIVVEPIEIAKNGVIGSEVEEIEKGASNSQQNQAGDDNQGQLKRFGTQQQYQRYQQLSGNRDKLELAMVRKQLAREWGLEAGIKRASVAYEQREQERRQVEEKRKEEKKVWEFEQKKQENQQVAMAKNVASAEKRMAVAG